MLEKKGKKNQKVKNWISADQYFLIFEKCFRVPKYGTTELVPFVCNKPQIKLLKNAYDRNVILKARKEGISTVVLAIAIVLCHEFKGFLAAFLAHDDKNTIEIFEKAKALVENANPSLGAIVGKRSIRFPNGSRITVSTAGAKGAYRGADLHFVHFSEIAQFQYPDVFASTLSACSKNAWIFVESTAKGRNLFYQLWEKSQGFPKTSDFKPFFFPWFEHVDNRIEITEKLALSPDERGMKSKYNLDDNQIAWYRWYPTTMVNPDEFLQEHPSYPAEAFLASGRPVFNQRMLERMKNSADDYRLGSLGVNRKHIVQFYDEDKNNLGELRIFHNPEPGKQYIFGGDVAEGKSGGDFSTLFGLDPQTMKQVCEFRSRLDPDQFAFKCNMIGRYYNDGLMAIERNGPGHTVNSVLYNQYHYPRMYMEDVEGATMITEMSNNIGFRTNVATREYLISHAKRAIRLGEIKINSIPCISECQAFEYNDVGKAIAPLGQHDDLVIAMMIANYVSTKHQELRDKYYPAEKDTSEYFRLIQRTQKKVSYKRNKRRKGYN